MSLYNSLKEMAYSQKREGQTELYEQLIDLSAQALELQHEAHRLAVENSELKKNNPIDKQIVRRKEPSRVFIFVK
jgi:regulator of replication initiation timing